MDCLWLAGRLTLQYGNSFKGGRCPQHTCPANWNEELSLSGQSLEEKLRTHSLDRTHASPVTLVQGSTGRLAQGLGLRDYRALNQVAVLSSSRNTTQPVFFVLSKPPNNKLHAIIQPPSHTIMWHYGIIFVTCPIFWSMLNRTETSRRMLSTVLSWGVIRLATLWTSQRRWVCWFITKQTLNADIPGVCLSRVYTVSFMAVIFYSWGKHLYISAVAPQVSVVWPTKHSGARSVSWSGNLTRLNFIRYDVICYKKIYIFYLGHMVKYLLGKKGEVENPVQLQQPCTSYELYFKIGLGGFHTPTQRKHHDWTIKLTGLSYAGLHRVLLPCRLLKHFLRLSAIVFIY